MLCPLKSQSSSTLASYIQYNNISIQYLSELTNSSKGLNTQSQNFMTQCYQILF